jgi:hypothetical protein
VWKLHAREPGGLQTPALDGSVGRSKKAKSRNFDMYVCGESDGFIVPAKWTNKADAQYTLAAESAEERRPTKGNAPQAHSRRTQSRGCESQGFVAHTTSCKKGSAEAVYGAASSHYAGVA